MNVKQKVMEKWNALLVKLGLRVPDQIWYIGGSDVLPQPLDRAREREVLEAFFRRFPQARAGEGPGHRFSYAFAGGGGAVHCAGSLHCQTVREHGD